VPASIGEFHGARSVEDLASTIRAEILQSVGACDSVITCVGVYVRIDIGDPAADELEPVILDAYGDLVIELIFRGSEFHATTRGMADFLPNLDRHSGLVDNILQARGFHLLQG
jgi:hypothetical protein